MNTGTKKQQYMQQAPTSNEMWLAQAIMNEFSEEEIENLHKIIAKLDEVMFKDWAKEMTFKQLQYSDRIIKSLEG